MRNVAAAFGQQEDGVRAGWPARRWPRRSIAARGGCGGSRHVSTLTRPPPPSKQQQGFPLPSNRRRDALATPPCDDLDPVGAQALGLRRAWRFRNHHRPPPPPDLPCWSVRTLPRAHTRTPGHARPRLAARTVCPDSRSTSSHRHPRYLPRPAACVPRSPTVTSILLTVDTISSPTGRRS